MAAILSTGSFGGDGPRRCSFCGRREDSVTHLVRSRGAYICDSCVSLANEAIAAAAPERRLLRIRPARAQIPDRDAAELAIEEAFETLFDQDLPVEARCAAIDQGSNLVETMNDVGRRYPTSSVDITVDSIRLVSQDEAEVQFAVLLARFGPSGLQRAGHAVRTSDGWKVARDTWCSLIGLAGVTCPPPEQDKPD
jgi:hypothetical protein